MKMRILSTALALCFAPLALAQGDNPFRKANVGDWVSYKISAKVGEFAVAGDMKLTISAKDDKNATLRMEVSVSGAKESRETKIDLNQAYDPSNLATLGGAPPGLKVEKGTEGKETIEVGGKKYETNWATLKMSGNTGDVTISSDTKIWMSKSVPLAGMVKMETNTKANGMVIFMTMEITGSGSK